MESDIDFQNTREIGYENCLADCEKFGICFCDLDSPQSQLIFKLAEERVYKATQAKRTAAVAAIKVDKEKDLEPEIPKFESVYELTLTTTKDDPYELRQWLFKIVRSRMFEVVAWKACVELTKAGIPHIHAVLYSKNKYCDKSKIKKLGYPYRYELARVRDRNAYENYLIKEQKNVNIINYCEQKGIPQFLSDKDALQKEDLPKKEDI